MFHQELRDRLLDTGLTPATIIAMETALVQERIEKGSFIFTVRGITMVWDGTAMRHLFEFATTEKLSQPYPPEEVTIPATKDRLP